MEVSSSSKNSILRCLQSQQCRLRHLRSLSCRNLLLTLPPDMQLLIDTGADLDFYFSLYLAESTDALYTSEKLCDISNLNWKSFNWSQLCDSINLSLPHIVVKLYATLKNLEEKPVLLLSQLNSFRSLRYLGEQIPKDNKQFPPNTLVFEMFEGYYSPLSEGIASNIIPSKLYGVPQRFENLEVISGTERKSYDLSSLKRVQMVQRAIRQTRASVLRVRRVINESLSTTEEIVKKRTNCECIMSRLSLLKDELDSQKQALQSLRKQSQELKQSNQDQGLELVKCGLILKKSEESLIAEERHLIDSKESLVRTNARLSSRRRQLISDLCCVYPIEEVSDKKYTICNVQLPNSEDFYGHDDIMISVALGYVCHLVTMITQFLHVPARYPTLHQGTRSRIYDHFLSTIPDNEREFPLFLRKKREDLRFKYGVYLLNKNISQLRLLSGLGTPDLRLTLQNLKALLELRLTNRLDQSISTPLDIERKSSLSILKQIPRLSEDPSGSNDSLNMGGSRQNSSPLWQPLPKGCRPASLSLSLDQGLDEISRLQHDRSNEQANHFHGNGNANHAEDSRFSTELRLSEPSLLEKDGNSKACKDDPLIGDVIGKALAPFQVYAIESDEPVEDKYGT